MAFPEAETGTACRAPTGQNAEPAIAGFESKARRECRAGKEAYKGIFECTPVVSGAEAHRPCETYAGAEAPASWKTVLRGLGRTAPFRRMALPAGTGTACHGLAETWARPSTSLKTCPCHPTQGKREMRASAGTACWAPTKSPKPHIANWEIGAPRSRNGHGVPCPYREKASAT